MGVAATAIDQVMSYAKLVILSHIYCLGIIKFENKTVAVNSLDIGHNGVMSNLNAGPLPPNSLLMATLILHVVFTFPCAEWLLPALENIQ